MKNTIDLPSSILRRRRILVRFEFVKMSLSMKTQIKGKRETFEHFKLLSFKIFTIKRFEKQKKQERKIDSGKKCALLSSKVRAVLKKQTAGRSAKSYRELGWKIQVHLKTVKKYLTKIGVHRKTKKSAPKSTARQQFVIKVRLKFLTQNFFSTKSI
jgi:hypothetical protein